MDTTREQSYNKQQFAVMNGFTWRLEQELNLRHVDFLRQLLYLTELSNRGLEQESNL